MNNRNEKNLSEYKRVTYLFNPLRVNWHMWQKQGSSTLSCQQPALQFDPNSNDEIVPVLFSTILLHVFVCGHSRFIFPTVQVSI